MNDGIDWRQRKAAAVGLLIALVTWVLLTGLAGADDLRAGIPH